MLNDCLGGGAMGELGNSCPGADSDLENLESWEATKQTAKEEMRGSC